MRDDAAWIYARVTHRTHPESNYGFMSDTISARVGVSSTGTAATALVAISRFGVAPGHEGSAPANVSACMSRAQYLFEGSVPALKNPEFD